jgi:hypothetical protein
MRLLIVTAFFANIAFGQSLAQLYRWDYLERDRQTFDKPAAGITAWPTEEEEAKEISREQIIAFLTGAAIVKKAEDVHDFRLVRLMPGKLYLVVVLEGGGKEGANWIELVYCEEKLCTGDELYSHPEIDLSEQLVSITGNGVFQIVTQVGSSFAIYEMGEKGPHEASRKYRDWYNQHLYPKMEEEIKIGPSPPAAPDVDRLDFMAALRQADGQYTMDEYRERVLGAKDAPMEHALEWANSPYPEIQGFARHAVRFANDSKLVEQVLDALEKSSAEYIRKDAIDIRKERAERRAEKEGKQ